MKNIKYTHKPTILLFSLVLSTILFFVSLYETYVIGQKIGISGYGFYFGIFFTIFFLGHAIFLYINIAKQTIEINSDLQSLTIFQQNLKTTAKVVIPFSKIENMNVVEKENDEYDIEVFLTDKKKFCLFSYGEYCKKDKATVTSQHILIEKLIFPKNESFFKI